MKILPSIILSAMVLLAACHSGKNKTRGEPSAETGKETVAFKKIENLRYGFTAQIPRDWEVTEPSDNGDGFILKVPDKKDGGADIRIYGSYEPLTKEENEKDTLEIFSFSDGREGQALNDGHNFVVQRILGESRFVVFSVKENSPGWINKHQKLLMQIAESISPVNE